MAKTSVILTARDESGKDLQKSLTDINPDATNAQLMTFAQKLNSMTKNTYISTTRVDKINCDTEPGDTRPTPTLTLDKTSDTVTNITDAMDDGSTNGYAYTISGTYTGDGDLFVVLPRLTSIIQFDDMLPSYVQLDGVVPFAGFTCYIKLNAQDRFTFRISGGNAEGPQRVFAGLVYKIGALETDNYKAPEMVTFTVTE